jgi:selenocysteine lyase/cysteine desulfurase
MKRKMKKILENIIIEPTRRYFDFTASGLAYREVEEKIEETLLTYANTHSNTNKNAIVTAEYYDRARLSLKRSLELDESFCLLPCGTGASGAIKKFQELLGIYIPPKTKQRYKIETKDKPLVIVGPFEHHSNEVSFREALCDLIRIPLCKEGYTDLKVLEEILEINSDREIIGSFSVASNVTGIFNPIEKISRLIRRYSGLLALDSATTSAYMNVDSTLYDAMFLAPHKLLGGVGSCGILVIKKMLIDTSLAPTFSGGGTVSYVSANQHIFLDNEEMREDGGTPGIVQLIRASLAYQLRNDIGLEWIHQKEEELKGYFISKAKNIKGLVRYCQNSKDKLPIFSFNLEGKNPYDIATQLSDDYNIDLRAGCSCAGPYGHDLLNLKEGEEFLDDKPGWIRISLHYIHTKEDIDYLIKAIEELS